MLTPSSILIVKLSAVGDVVHTLPALNALRKQFPSARIGWAVQKGAHNLLEFHPQLDRLIVLPRKLKTSEGRISLSELRSMIREDDGWEVAIDFQGLTKSGIAACLSGAPVRIGLGNKWSRELNWLFINHKVSPEAQPVIQMNLGLLAPLMPVPDEAIAILHSSEEDEVPILQWSQTRKPSKYIVIDPFAGWPTKLWKDDYWVQLACFAGKESGLPVLVIYGPGEKERAAEIVDKMRAAGADPELAPETTLRQLTILLRRFAAAFIGADTGPMHMAAALGIPTVAIFGPSDSRRNAPTFSNARFRVLQDFSMPCSGTFTRHCRYHEPGGCMDSITPTQVFKALIELLNSDSGRSRASGLAQ
jgi:lipopolysaccharide heptosyltransferase I